MDTNHLQYLYYFHTIKLIQIEYETCGLSLFTLFVKRRTNSCEKSREKGEGGNWGAATQYMYDS